MGMLVKNEDNEFSTGASSSIPHLPVIGYPQDEMNNQFTRSIFSATTHMVDNTIQLR